MTAEQLRTLLKRLLQEGIVIVDATMLTPEQIERSKQAATASGLQVEHLTICRHGEAAKAQARTMAQRDPHAANPFDSQCELYQVFADAQKEAWN